MDFDKFVDRNQYPTMKWNRDFLADHYGNPDAIPMSVADMDLKTPQVVIEQLQKRAAHGIYGYESKPDSFFDAVEGWYKKRHGWQIDRTQIEQCPSILNAVAVLIAQHSNEGDGVILQAPVFFEFKMVVNSNGRKVVKNPLKMENGRYEIDFADLEAKTADPHNKILILCNPHNPVGRVWTRAELEQVATICERNNVFVISDEIHGDFAFAPHRYTPYLTVTDGQSAAACISPAKTFNISGMVDALAIIPNETIRNRYHDFAHRFQINKNNVFAMLATETAYRHGEAWLDELLLYLRGNVDFIKTYLRENELKVSVVEPEGTFLLWLDFRELGMDAKVLERFLADEVGVALSQGYWFGREGAGFARMTIGCPRVTIEKMLQNLKRALDSSQNEA